MAQNHTPVNHIVDFYKKSLSSTFSKEAEPSSRNEIEYREVVEHEPSPDVQKFVESRPDNVRLDAEMEKMGVEATVAQNNFQAQKGIKLPLSDEKIIEGLEQPVTSSWRWLATLAMYLLKTTHYTLKRVKGRVQRVVFA